MSKISVLIPVYNVEAYLEQCLESVVKQTEKDIEIICVDDASTDGSLEILKRFREKDKRIRLICHEVNQGTSKARKDAVLMAESEYIMFVDSDDYLALNACEELYKNVRKADVDVMQFGTEVIHSENVTEQFVEWIKNFMEPSEEKITDGELLKACFVDKKLNCNLVNKIWKNECCQKAIMYLTDEKFITAEDRYMCFLFLYHMRTYAGIKKRYYYYRAGIGITGSEILDLERFKKRCQGAYVVSKVRRFLSAMQAYEKHKEIYMHFSNDILWDCVDCWYKKLKKSDQPEGFQILRQHWTPGEITGALARTFFEEQEKIEQGIVIKNDKKIGIYYRYVGYGAMDSIIKRYADYYTSRGWNVTLITDADAPETGRQYMGYELTHIPAATDANWDKYAERGDVLEKRLKDIGKLVYLSPTSHVMTLDKIVAEAQGVVFQAAMDEYALDCFNRREQEIIGRYEDELSEVNRKQEATAVELDDIKKKNIQYKTKIEELGTEKQNLEDEIKHIYGTKCGKMMKFVQGAGYQLRCIIKIN